jgi:hypothetical protein
MISCRGSRKHCFLAKEDVVDHYFHPLHSFVAHVHLISSHKPSSACHCVLKLPHHTAHSTTSCHHEIFNHGSPSHRCSWLGHHVGFRSGGCIPSSVVAIHLQLVSGKSVKSDTTPSLPAADTSATASLSPGCKATLESLLSPNSTSGMCLNIQGLFPVLSNNDSSIIPQINDYLTTVCATPACTNATILNVTTSVASACSTELSYFGIDNSTLAIITNAYPTAREVACLTT